ncbi:hypothetical protein P7C70_g2740, partial [Phenoliferia sp. Uapishka_3]
MTQSLSLPPELVWKILKFAVIIPRTRSARERDHEYTTRRYATLLSLCLTSHDLREMAQPLLFSWIRLRTKSAALKLLASAALRRYRVEALLLSGRSCSRRMFSEDDMTGAIAVAVVEAFGKLGLKELELASFRDLNASVLELAGPDLESLDICTSFTCTPDNHPKRWTFPFKLRHLGFHGCGEFSLQLQPTLPLFSRTGAIRAGEFTPSFMPALLTTSATKTSLNIHETFDVDIFLLPEFPSFARHVTTFAVAADVLPWTNHDHFLHFSAVNHLVVNFPVTMEYSLRNTQNGRRDPNGSSTVKECVELFPSDSPTITHLTVSLPRIYLEPFFESQEERDAWSEITTLPALGALEQITWSKMGAARPEAFPELMVNGRKVRMEWEGEDQM